MENEKTFEDYKKAFARIIDICITHNNQSSELDCNYNNPVYLNILKKTLLNREMYLDTFIKIQLASLNDPSLYFNSSYSFGYIKFIDVDRIINTSNTILHNKFGKTL